MHKREYLKMASTTKPVFSSFNVPQAQFCKLFNREENPRVVIAILNSTKSQVVDIIDVSWVTLVNANNRLSAFGKSFMSEYLGSPEYFIDVSLRIELERSK
jgi:hypothetical protein